MKYESGTELLRTIETIASCKQLALRPIAEALPNVDAGQRANLIYTLSLIGGSQAHGMIARQMSDGSPIVRYEAAAALLQFKDVSGVPVLIGFLDDPDRRMRFKSIQALTDFTHEDFGYDFGAPEPVRAEAVGRWKTWWGNRRSELVYQP
jgi:HEAT repeat protein